MTGCIGSDNLALESERIRIMADSALLNDLPSSVAPKHVFLAVVPDPRESYVQCTAETAECTCPEFCERDHDRD